MIDLKSLPGRPEYAFLRDHPRLGSRIMLLGVSGSHDEYREQYIVLHGKEAY